MSRIDGPLPVFTRFYESPTQAVVGSGTVVLAHGLGVEPKLVQLVAECQVAEHGYAIGDRILFEDTQGGGTSRPLGEIIDATNITLIFNSNANVLTYISKTTHLLVTFTNSSWQMFVRAFA